MKPKFTMSNNSSKKDTEIQIRNIDFRVSITYFTLNVTFRFTIHNLYPQKKYIKLCSSVSKFQFVQFNKKNLKLSPEKNPKRKNHTTVQGEYVLFYQSSKMIVLFTSRYDQLDGWLAMSKPQKEHPRQGQFRTPE